MSIAQSVIGTLVFMAFSLTVGRRIVSFIIRWVNDHFVSELAVITAVLVGLAVAILAIVVTFANKQGTAIQGTNVPNPAGMPYLAGASLAHRQAAQRAAVGMTRTVVNPLASSNRAVIDLMCYGRSYQTTTYSPDGLHPSDAGYAFIAAEVVRAVTTSTYAPPQSSCAKRGLPPPA